MYVKKCPTYQLKTKALDSNDLKNMRKIRFKYRARKGQVYWKTNNRIDKYIRTLRVYVIKGDIQFLVSKYNFS